MTVILVITADQVVVGMEEKCLDQYVNHIFICPGPDPGSKDGLESEQVGQKLTLEELIS